MEIEEIFQNIYEVETLGIKLHVEDKGMGFYFVWDKRGDCGMPVGNFYSKRKNKIEAVKKIVEQAIERIESEDDDDDY